MEFVFCFRCLLDWLWFGCLSICIVILCFLMFMVLMSRLVL